MEKSASKYVAVTGSGDKRAKTSTFVINLPGNFLQMQLIDGGKTDQSLLPIQLIDGRKTDRSLLPIQLIDGGKTDRNLLSMQLIDGGKTDRSLLPMQLIGGVKTDRNLIKLISQRVFDSMLIWGIATARKKQKIINEINLLCGKFVREESTQSCNFPIVVVIYVFRVQMTKAVHSLLKDHNIFISLVPNNVTYLLVAGPYDQLMG